MRTTVAVTGLNSGANPQPGTGVIKSLRRRFKDLVIIGLIYDSLESGVYAEDTADVVFKIPYPSAGSEALLQRLDYITYHYPIDVLIPTLDVEIPAYISIQNKLEERGIRMYLPTIESLRSRSKSELKNLVSLCDCKTPETRTAADSNNLQEIIDELGFPVYVKGQFYEAHKVNTFQALTESFYAVMSKWGAPVLIQQCITGNEFDIMAVGDGTGKTAGFCPIMKSIRSELGKGYGGVVIRDEKLNTIGMDLIRHLEWRGPLEIEFIQDDVTKEYYLLEINPRFPAWVDFPSSFGSNMPALILDELLHGGMVHLPPCEPGVFYIRHTVDLTCRIEDLGNLTTSGEWNRSGVESKADGNSMAIGETDG